MAALSDYLESGLLSHLFRNTAFPRPANICIALTSGVPKDSDTGETIPELKSVISVNSVPVNTNYQRIDLGPPATSGDRTWYPMGVDSGTAYSVSGTKHNNTMGYFYPLYLSSDMASQLNGEYDTYTFQNEFPSVVFYGPGNGVTQSGVTTKSSFTDYEGNGFIKNKNQIIFGTAVTEWGWVSGIAIVDNSMVGSGNLLMHSKLANPRYVYIGDNIRFDVNSLEISLK